MSNSKAKGLIKSGLPRQILIKVPISKLHENPSSVRHANTCRHTDTRTDRHDKINMSLLHIYAKAPKENKK